MTLLERMNELEAQDKLTYAEQKELACIKRKLAYNRNLVPLNEHKYNKETSIMYVVHETNCERIIASKEHLRKGYKK